MKQKILTLGLSILIHGLVYTPNETNSMEMGDEDRLNRFHNIMDHKKDDVNEIDIFLSELGKKESGNNYDIINDYGYLGKYQFSINTIRGLGYNITEDDFLNNPDLQEQIMMDYLLLNKKYLQSYIDVYDGHIIGNDTITESGILAAAHLSGKGNVRRYFKRGINVEDSYGTSLTEYLYEFSGYSINLN